MLVAKLSIPTDTVSHQRGFTLKQAENQSKLKLIAKLPFLAEIRLLKSKLIALQSAEADCIAIWYFRLIELLRLH